MLNFLSYLFTFLAGCYVGMSLLSLLMVNNNHDELNEEKQEIKEEKYDKF